MKAFSEESRKPVSVFFGGEHVSCECGAAAPQAFNRSPHDIATYTTTVPAGNIADGHRFLSVVIGDVLKRLVIKERPR